MRRTALIALMLLGCRSREIQVNTADFYAPTVRTMPATRTIAVDAEIAPRAGKQSWVYLFEKYGFSGNGPSIEQVVRRNVSSVAGRYDSEADMFAFEAESDRDFQAMSQQLTCLERMPCLQAWLENARSIILKE